MKHKTLPNPTQNPNPNPKPKKMTRINSTPLPLCFRPSTTTTTTPSLKNHHTPPSTTKTSTPNLTTSLYQTHLGIFSITWSHTIFSRSFHLTLHPPPPLSLSIPSPLSLSSPSFHLTLKPFLFWNKHGFKKLPFSHSSSPLYIYWDLTHAKFGPGPEPISGFYIAVVLEGEITLLVGDLEKEAFAKTKSKKTGKNIQSLVIRREHVFGDKLYSTRIKLGGNFSVILIELNDKNEDPKLEIRFDSKRVLQVKHLKWKFRGSERIEVDGTHILVSWDVYNWLFDEDCGSHDDGFALFTFRFEDEKDENEEDEDEDEGQDWNYEGKKGGVIWSQDLCGLNYERKKMKKKLLVKSKNGSFSSISSSGSSGSSSSVLEWESVEENELKGPTGFSLLLYAWKR